MYFDLQEEYPIIEARGQWSFSIFFPSMNFAALCHSISKTVKRSISAQTRRQFNGDQCTLVNHKRHGFVLPQTEEGTELSDYLIREDRSSSDLFSATNLSVGRKYSRSILRIYLMPTYVQSGNCKWQMFPSVKKNNRVIPCPRTDCLVLVDTMNSHSSHILS